MPETISQNFYVMYQFQVSPEKEEQFVEAWGKLTAEVRLRFESFGCNLHLVENGFIAYAQWPDQISWKSFWGEREEKIDTLPALRDCLSGDTVVTPLPGVSSSLTISPSSYLVFD